MRPLALVCLAACAPETTEAPPKDRNTEDILEVPDLTGIDFPAAYGDAIRLATTVVGSQPWNTHVAMLADRDPACPDVFAGVPDGEIDDLDPDMGGSSWLDFCETGAGETWAGWAWWLSEGVHAGDVEQGLNTDFGSRELIADATVQVGDGARWEFDGAMSESVNYPLGQATEDWTWSSLIEGTFTGSDAFAGSATPSGWRTDLYLEASRGNTGRRLEARGNVYLFDARHHERFDSLVMDLEVLDAAAAGPEGCVQEPLGWIGLRDTDAVWYDLVFLPRTGDDITAPPYENPHSVCDGCGTLYVRGVESGEICVDLSFALDLIDPPDVQSFVLPHRGLP